MDRKEFVCIRSETLEELGKGFHFHSLIKKPIGKPPFQINREMKNTVDKIVDVNNHHFYNIKYITSVVKKKK